MLEFLLSILGSLFCFFLHVDSTGSFPKALSAAEERECLGLIRRGDDAARKRLIEHNLRLVAHIVKKYYLSGADQDDLISIGTIGLIKSVSTFDAEKGTRFSTYAARCIENEILMYFRSLKKVQNDVYISDPIDTDKEGNSLTLIDVIAGDENIADNVDLAVKISQLRRFMKRLTTRERRIIELRYGIGDKRPLTQREVAKRMMISRSYVSRIEKKALMTLRSGFDCEDKM